MINREIDFDLNLFCQSFYYLMTYCVGFNRDLRSYFKTSPQAQSLRWIEMHNPRNSLLLLWLSTSIRLDLEPA
jgi:hypothetical protein